MPIRANTDAMSILCAVMFGSRNSETAQPIEHAARMVLYMIDRLQLYFIFLKFLDYVNISNKKINSNDFERSGGRIPPEGGCRKATGGWKEQLQNRAAKLAALFCSGRRTRTTDLRVMSPTSYQLLYPAMWSAKVA